MLCRYVQSKFDEKASISSLSSFQNKHELLVDASKDLIRSVNYFWPGAFFACWIQRCFL